jgi:hypothetical protein
MQREKQRSEGVEDVVWKELVTAGPLEAGQSEMDSPLSFQKEHSLHTLGLGLLILRTFR